ncbi:MAG: hypothetical protein DRO23_10200 [Thermoprotei archaeon]|mgnify:FL=1|nr:MAG: hypothetical protein DRO23_10200 [Thermoprotei archaeon]
MGYIKDLLHTGIIPVFYIEINDAWSHRFQFISAPKPQVGITYKYVIIPAYEDGEWECIILREKTLF